MDAPTPPPSLDEILDRAPAQIAAGHVVPAAEVHRMLRRTIADMEARATTDAQREAVQRR